MDSRALRRCRAQFAIDLHPCHAADALRGIREQLDAWLLRWNDDLGGVMLAYSNITLLSSQARIHPYFPYFHVDLAADVHLFAPAPGYALTGLVNKIGADYMGLLVLGIFNAAIGRQSIRSEFEHHAMDNSWVSQQDSSHRIEEGTSVVFAVHTVQNEGSFFSLTGKLEEPWTGAAGQAGSAQEHRKKKKRRAEVAADARGEPAAEAPEQPPANSLKKKKRKHREGVPPASEELDQQQRQEGAVASAPDTAVKLPQKKKRKHAAAADGAGGSAGPSNGSQEKRRKHAAPLSMPSASSNGDRPAGHALPNGHVSSVQPPGKPKKERRSVQQRGESDTGKGVERGAAGSGKEGGAVCASHKRVASLEGSAVKPSAEMNTKKKKKKEEKHRQTN